MLTHGSAGELQLGATLLSGENIQEYEAQFASISAALTEDADFLIYGCNVAQGEAGQAFVEQLASLTGADVASSNDLTGAAYLGGDGQLEVSTGSIDAQAVDLGSYSALLAPTLGGLSSVSYTEQQGQITVASGATVSGGTNYGNGYVQFSVSLTRPLA